MTQSYPGLGSKQFNNVASTIHICNLSVRVLLTSINYDKPGRKTLRFSQKAESIKGSGLE